MAATAIGPFHKHGPYQYPFVAHDWVSDKIRFLSLSLSFSLFLFSIFYFPRGWQKAEK